MNEYSLEEKQTTKSAYRRISVRATDQAIGNIAPLFGMPTSPIRVMGAQPSISQSRFEPRPALQDPTEVQEVIHSSMPTENVQDHNQHMTGSKAHQYFEIDGDHLVARTADFKGKSRRAQQERYILLYIWANHQIFNKPLVSQKLIYDSAKVKKLYDRNMPAYFTSVASRFLTKGESGYRVNIEGEKEIDQIMGEIEQGSLKGFAYWESASKPARKRASLSAEDQKQVKDWLTKSTNVDNYDIRNLKKAVQYAMFTLWVLTKNLKVDTVVKPIMAYAYLTGKFTTVPISAKAFSNALTRSYNKKWFLANPNGLYYLSAEAEKEVEKWINGGPVADSSELADEKEDEEEDLEANE